MNKSELAADLDVKLQSHRRVLREMGWEEDGINHFLSLVKKNLLALADNKEKNNND